MGRVLTKTPWRTRIHRSSSVRPRWPFTINRDSPQARGLVAWYPGAFGPPFSIKNVLTQGADATLAGGAAPLGDVEMGIVTDLDGVNDHAQMDGLVSVLADLTVGSMSCWVRLDNDDDSENEFIAVSRDVDATITELRFTYDVRPTRDNFRPLYTQDGTLKWGAKTAEGTTDPHIGKWTLLELVQDGIEPVLYINGIKETLTYDVTEDKTLWFKGLFTDAATPADSFNVGILERNGSDIVPLQGRFVDLRIGSNITSAALAYQKWVPRTRWDLYHELGRVFYSVPAAAAAPAPSVTDSVTVAETIVMNLKIMPSVTDTVTVAESVTVFLLPALFMTLTDTVTATESVSTLLPFLAPTVNDTVTVTEATSVLLPFLTIVDTDTVTITESITAHRTGITIGEAVTVRTIVMPAVTDSVTIAESAEIGRLTMQITDAVTISESVVAFPPELFISLSDTVTVIDVRAITLSFAPPIFLIVLFKKKHLNTLLRM